MLLLWKLQQLHMLPIEAIIKSHFMLSILVLNIYFKEKCLLTPLLLVVINSGLSQVFMITKDPNPGLEGHVFPNPVDAEGYMVMLVYKNGSLTREGTVVVNLSGTYIIYCLFAYKPI